MSYNESEKQTDKSKDKKLADRWATLNGKKGDMLRRCEDYSMWTLPYIFPLTSSKHTELQGAIGSVGARAVNHLSNKIILTLFQPAQPFFRLMVSNDVIADLSEEAKQGDQDAQEVLNKLDKILSDAEKDAMRELDYNKYRTEATNVAKNLIITGNALIYHPEDGSRVQSYNLRDYCIVRDLSGHVIEIMTRDTKDLFTFSPEVQEVLRNAKGNKKKYDKDNCQVTLYTRLCLENDGKFHLTQDADDIKLDSTGAWPKEELPWIPLTWNLIRGEDYGRGLVEDYAGTFHALYVLNNALVDAVGIAADIKFLVNPASVLDVKVLNESDSGSYHSGKEGDVTTVQLDKQIDLAIVESAVERFTREIAQAFLLNSAITRDAERVTAEEIRYNATELEMSHGGIYSRFAEEWQYPTAALMLKRVNINIGKGRTVYPQIITGLDSLSRAGDLDNLRMWVSDLTLLNEVPDALIAVIDPAKFAQYAGVRRGVDYEKILKSQPQMEEEAQQAAQAQTDMINAEAAPKIAGEVAKAAIKEE